jgi:hypothetical protein
MHNPDGPRSGPHRSAVDDGGRVVGWVTYATGDTVYCPGAYRERRQVDRGDRRHAPRSGPCRHKWGRPGPRTETSVRVRRMGQSPAPGTTLILECPDCHCPIEFLTVQAAEAA